MILTGEVDGVPTTVVSLNPSVNEYLALLGVDLAGVDAFSYRPRELLKKRRVGTFVDLDVDVVEKIRPDLVVLYYPVQRHLLETAARLSKAVVAVPTPTSVDHVVAIFKFFARLFDRDEEGDRIAEIYRSLLEGPPIYEGVVAVINLGVYDVACRNSYLADALTKVGLAYMKTPPCVFRHFEKPPADILKKAGYVIYESSGKKFIESETAFLADKPHLVTPNDTLAHYGPSLPLDLRLVADAAARGIQWVGETSGVTRPSLRDDWYRPYR